MPLSGGCPDSDCNSLEFNGGIFEGKVGSVMFLEVEDRGAEALHRSNAHAAGATSSLVESGRS